MLKSLLIKIRRKPKAVRQQVAFWSAVVITMCLLLVWVITLPSRLSSGLDDDTPGIFSSLREEMAMDAPDIAGLVDEFNELTATTSDEFNIEEDNESATGTASSNIQELPPAEPAPTSTTADIRPVRIATTSADTATSSDPIE